MFAQAAHRARVTALAAVAGCFVLAPPTQAVTTASIEGKQLVVTGDDGADDIAITYRAEPGTVKRFVVQEQNGDEAPLPGTGCVRVRDSDGKVLEPPSAAVECPAAGLFGARLDTGDGTNKALAAIPIPVTINGGDGNDNVRGGSGGDAIFGREGSDVLAGDTGPDTIVAGPDDDSVYGDDGADPNLDGGDGADQVYGGGGADTIDGGPKNDNLAGGDGGDTIRDTGGGRDSFSGDGASGIPAPGAKPAAGNDTIISIDGLVESVVCGGGDKDVAFADSRDLVEQASCETWERRKPPNIERPSGFAQPDEPAELKVRPAKDAKLEARPSVETTPQTGERRVFRIAPVRLEAAAIYKLSTVNRSVKAGKRLRLRFVLATDVEAAVRQTLEAGGRAELRVALKVTEGKRRFRTTVVIPYGLN